MMMIPKGYDYWVFDNEKGNSIRDDAPEWAKKEFEEYVSAMKREPDKDGVIIMS